MGSMRIPGQALGIAVAFGTFVAFSTTTALHAQSVEEFYKSSRVDMLIGLSTGGGYDRYARITARHIGKYIPGNPTIIPRNMTGGGSLVMANFAYNVAPQDGSVIAAPQRGVPLEPLVAGKDSKAKLDPLKMHWIGSLARETSVAVAWHTSGIKSYKDLYEREFIAGGTGATTDSVITGYIMRNLLGMQFRMIAGYPGGTEVNLAMERGEVMGRATNSWSSIKSGSYAEHVKDGRLIILYQMGAKKNEEGPLKDVPLALDFAKDPRTRQILFLKFGVNEFGYPYFMGPGVPKDRVAAVRAAFVKASKDPELVAEVEKSRMDLNPIFAEEMHELLEQMYASPPDIVEALRKASEPTGPVEEAPAAAKKK